MMTPPANLPLKPIDNDDLHLPGSISSSSLALSHHTIGTAAERLYRIDGYNKYSDYLVPKLVSATYLERNSNTNKSIGQHGRSSSYHQSLIVWSAHHSRVTVDLVFYCGPTRDGVCYFLSLFSFLFVFPHLMIYFLLPERRDTIYPLDYLHFYFKRAAMASS